MIFDGALYFTTLSSIPQCDLVLDAANIKSPGPSVGLRQEDLVDSIIFKASDVVVVHFRDVDFNFARKGTSLCQDLYIQGCHWPLKDIAPPTKLT